MIALSARVVLTLFVPAALATAPRAQSCGVDVVLNRLDAGVAGPELATPDGAPVIGGAFSLRVERALPNTAGAMVFSAVEAPFFEPTYGATFWFGSPFGTMFFTTDGDGRSPALSAVAEVDPFFCGELGIFQAGVFDAGATGGVAVTNAIRLRVGEPNAPLFRPDFVATNVEAVAFADLDGDGIDEMLLAQSPTARLGVLRGLPTGGFGPLVQYLTGDAPAGVSAGDLNGDGDADVVVTNQNSSTLSIFYGNGSGGFLGSATVFSGGGVTESALADLDGDGDLDVAAAAAATPSISLHENFGGAVLGFPTSVPAGSNVWDVVAADLDEDGELDLVAVSENTDEVSVLLGNGDGTLSAPLSFGVGNVPRALVVGDLDGDTFLDVATANHGSDDVSVLLGDGTGALRSRTDHPTGLDTKELVLTDLAEDGTPDLLVASALDDTLTLLRGDGMGGFTATEHVSTLFTSSVGVTDHDLDGLRDVVVAGVGGYGVLRGDGTGDLIGGRRYGVGSSPTQAAVADLDGDGLTDVAVLNGGTNDVSVLLGTGQGRLSPSGTYSSGLDPTAIALADLDGDGFADLLVLNRSSGQESVSVLLNQADATFAAAVTQPISVSNPGQLVVRDLNGDLAPDVLVMPTGSSNYAVLLGNGDGTLQASIEYAVTGQPRDIAVEDLDGNGSPDVAVTLSNNQTSVLLNDGAGAFGPASTYASGTAYLAAADLTGDGARDLVSHDFTTNSVTVLLNDGSGVFAAAPAVNLDLEDLELADMTGDGVADLVGTLGFTVRVLPANGDGTFGASLISPATLDTFAQLHVVDVNGDGRLDVVTTNTFEWALDWFEGQGDGTLAPSVRTAVGRDVRPITIADLDRDGIPDVLVPDGFFRELTVLLNLLGE